MLFQQPTFIVFFVAVLLLHNLRLPWSLRKFNLLLCSYIFYAAWRPEFVILIWISTLIDWFASRAIHRSESRSQKWMWLCASLATNLGLLGYFKYAQFLYDNVWVTLGYVSEPVDLGITLPVGISFYTFQTLSYSIDIFRGKTKPSDSFLDYALYVTFFPQLVAGPIVRSTDFLPQCKEPKRGTPSQISWGLVLFVIGLFEKLVVADGLLAKYSDRAFNSAERLTFIDSWMGTFAFAGQVFCDFAGYSTCAIGIAMCLGFSFQDNFRFPYAAIGFSDFWQRWHISLSSWLRDYLYIPLGGNRKGSVRTYVNLMLTMLIGGLWHGASWSFVVWGGLHGLYLMLERMAKQAVGSWQLWQIKPIQLLLAVGTFLLVCLTWVFFRAPTFEIASTFVQTMANPSGGTKVFNSMEVCLIGGVMAIMLGLHWILRDSTVEDAAAKLPWWLRSTLLAFMIIAIFNIRGDDRAFIYFVF